MTCTYVLWRVSWGDIREITYVVAAAGETGDSAGYEVRGASARGWLCRGKRWDHVCTSWAPGPERASHLQHLLEWGGQLELTRLPLAIPTVLPPPADRETCVLVTFVLAAMTSLPPLSAGERCRLWFGWRTRVGGQSRLPKVPVVGPSYRWARLPSAWGDLWVSRNDVLLTLQYT